MKRFLVSIVCFFLLLFSVDQMYGLCCKYLNNHPKRGETYYRDYLVNKTCDDVIMFGSSRMAHHYVSNILADSLRMTVWNAGVDGMGIIMNYGYLELLLQHHKPKVILYDISPFDFCVDDNVKQLKNLKPYSSKEEIKAIFNMVKDTEMVKNYSKLFQFNSSLLPLLRDFIKAGGKGDQNGYSPLFGVMDDLTGPEIGSTPEIDWEIDQLKIDLLEQFESKCISEGIQLFFLVSPEFCFEDSALSNKVGSLLNGGAPFLNYSYIDEISNNNKLFQDRQHLNNEGASLFTRLLSKRLRSVILS